jgi:hypothetical protein
MSYGNAYVEQGSCGNANRRKDSRLPLDIEIKEYVRDADLSNLVITVSYRVDGVHLYILNVADMQV